MSLLPLFLLIWLHETGTAGSSPPDTPGQLFADGSVSNRQLQVTIAHRVRVVGLAGVADEDGRAQHGRSRCSSFLLGARRARATSACATWLEDERYDRLALHLSPLVLALRRAGRRARADAGGPGSRGRSTSAARCRCRRWRSICWRSTAGCSTTSDVSLQRFQSADVDDPCLLDTLAALTLNGIAFYLLASALERGGRI